MFFRLTKKAFKAQKLQELKSGGDLDLIILDMMDFQIMDKENKETPPFLVKQEYQALLELPYQQKFIIFTYVSPEHNSVFVMGIEQGTQQH